MLFVELKNKKNFFRRKYIKNLINRFSNASLSMEGYDGNFGDTIQALNILYQTEALEMALVQEESNRPMTQCYDLIELIKWISGGEQDNYRKTQAVVNGSSVRRSLPQMIRNDLYYMFDNYNNFIKYSEEVDEIYLKEAQLHIRLLHIHPFEDGNGRIARIILIRNLLRQNKVPCVITKEDKAEYCQYIENGDEIGLAKFFQRLSEKELKTILCLYNELNDKGLIKENLMTEDQQKRYEEIIERKKDNYRNKKTVLRNISDILNIFFHGQTVNDNNIVIHKMYRHKMFLDYETDDFAVYCEDSQMLIIKKTLDQRMFMVKKMDNKIYFFVENQEMYAEEFEFELQKQEEILENSKQYKKISTHT